MRVDQFDFDLPKELIALHPAVPRDAARMLVVRADGSLVHAKVRDLPDFLDARDVLVVNDTKVIAARLRGRRIGRGAANPKIEVMLHKRIAPGAFLGYARPARKVDVGDRLLLGESLEASIAVRGEGGEIELRFDMQGAELESAIATQGEVPLPPYISGKRALQARDVADYQTMFADKEGSVAAPTAGLHFTPDLVASLAARGIGREQVTLHIGAGTFLPVRAQDTSEHRMHSEWAGLDGMTADRLNQVRQKGGRVVAVGTTTLRTLESAATPDGQLHAFRGETEIFITPGYRFLTAEVLVTNFHLPRSTLFMLVSAFSGAETIQAAYQAAIHDRYRFYSYGDACLLFRRPQ